MKSITIISVKELSDDVRNLIVKNKSDIFTINESNVIKNHYEFDDSSNWFGGSHNPLDSVVYNVFAQDVIVDDLLKSLKDYKNEKGCENSVQAFTSVVENSI